LEEAAEAFIQEKNDPHSDFQQTIFGVNIEGRDVFPFATLFLYFVSGNSALAVDYAARFSEPLAEFIASRIYLLEPKSSFEYREEEPSLPHIEAQQLVQPEQASDPYLKIIVELLNGFLTSETPEFRKEVLWGDINCIMW